MMEGFFVLLWLGVCLLGIACCLVNDEIRWVQRRTISQHTGKVAGALWLAILPGSCAISAIFGE